MDSTFEERRDATEPLLRMVEANLGGEPTGLYSICSANRFVLDAGISQARLDGTILSVESTSNQVNQFGGYSGMTPAEFARFVRRVALDMGFPTGKITLGGDHLGPHVWRREPASVAMAKACELVRSCVLAGYVKIHLDTSMRCADDPGEEGSTLGEEKVTERAAELCRAAEEARAGLPAGSAAPLYVIGTEVPPPGGETSAAHGLAVTRAEDALRTIELTREAFLSRGLESAWERVIALVVQPGVEFGDTSVVEYNPEKARHLSSCIGQCGHLVFEAHSTDHQRPRALGQLVRDHFAILKVGPWLTFAFREAVFALAEIERELLSQRKGVTLSCIREVLDRAMRDNPEWWEGYYRGDEDTQRLARKYSYCDRSRYYWPRPEVAEAVERLLANLSDTPVPMTLLSQYLPAQYEGVREGSITGAPRSLIRSKIMEVTGIYSGACGTRSETQEQVRGTGRG